MGIVFRWFRLSAMQSLAGLVVAALLALASLMIAADNESVRRWATSSNYPPVLVIIFAVVVASALGVAIVVWTVMAIRWTWSNWQVEAFSHDAPANSAATDEERRIILNTLAAGKVTPLEAEELLKAVGEKGSQKPAARWTVGFLISTLLIVIGFVLPWAHFSHVGIGLLSGEGYEGYQAGYHQGAVGWIVLTLGVLPAILMCIPALDRHVQLIHLRLILAGCGFALVCPWILNLVEFAINAIAAPLMYRQLSEARPGIGIVLLLLGFAAQILSAAIQSGLLRRKAPKAAPAQ
jgi:hypothetical protein